MRYWLRTLFATAIVALVAPAHAAITTVPIGGTINGSDGQPAQGGSITCTLKPGIGRASDGVNTQVVMGPYKATIGANGAISFSLVPNDVITPAGTVYECRVVTTGGNGTALVEQVRVDTIGSTTYGALARVGGPTLTLPTITGATGTIQTANSSSLAPATGYLWNSVTGSLYAPAASGAISQGYSSAAFTPARSHWSDLAAARAHALLWGEPEYYLQPAVFDTWNEIFINHPLYADCDNNATAGGACVDEQPAPLIAKCYAANCTTDVGFYCITTTDSTANGIVDDDNDGSADFAVGDVVLAGQPSGNISKGGPTHRIIAITTDNANCSATGSDNTIQVDPAVNQNAAYEIDTDANGTVDTGVAMVRLWKNDTHPSNVGADHMGYRLAYASRLMYGRQGPNILRNGAMDWNTITENITGLGCTVTARTWLATPTTGLTDRDAREGPAYNSIDCGTSVTSTDYLETVDSYAVVPGERYVLSGLLKSNNTAVISLVDDRNNSGGVFSDAGDMAYTLGALQPANQYANSLAPFWATFEIPVGAGGGGGAVGIHRVKPRWRKGGTTANSPQLDMWSLRKVTTWDSDSVIEGGRASSVFLINDPGARNIVLAGDSWFASANLGSWFKAGLARGLLARTGHDYTAQIIPTGASGQTIAYLLDNFYTLIEAYDPLYVVVQVGTNDVIAGTTQANFIARYRMLAARIQSIGAIPILLTQAPLGPAGGANMTTSHNYRDAMWRAFMNDNTSAGAPVPEMLSTGSATNGGNIFYGAIATTCATVCTNVGKQCSGTFTDITSGASNWVANCTDTTGTTYHMCACF